MERRAGRVDADGGCTVASVAPTAITCACTRLSIEVAIRYAGLEQRRPDVFASNAAIIGVEAKRLSIAYFVVFTLISAVAAMGLIRGIKAEPLARRTFAATIFANPEVAATRALLSVFEGGGDVVAEVGFGAAGAGGSVKMPTATVVPLDFSPRRPTDAGSLFVLLDGASTAQAVLSSLKSLRKNGGSAAAIKGDTGGFALIIEQQRRWRSRPFQQLRAAFDGYSPALSRTAHVGILTTATLLGFIVAPTILLLRGDGWPSAASFCAAIAAASMSSSASYILLVTLWRAGVGHKRAAAAFGAIGDELRARREAEAAMSALSDAQLVGLVDAFGGRRAANAAQGDVKAALEGVAARRLQSAARTEEEPGPVASVCLAALVVWLLLAAVVRGFFLGSATGDATAIVLFVTFVATYGCLVPLGGALCRHAERLLQLQQQQPGASAAAAAPAVLSLSLAAATAAAAAAAGGDVVDTWGATDAIISQDRAAAGVSARRRTLCGIAYILALDSAGQAEETNDGLNSELQLHKVSAAFAPDDWDLALEKSAAFERPQRGLNVG